MAGILDQYITTAPSDDNAASIFKGEWSSRFPAPRESCSGGTTPLFEDPRISWAITELGGVSGKNILELGPLEGGHTYMLEQHGAESVLAIESNTRAFLKCLIVKEILSLKRARFLCGDFREFLRGNTASYDVVFASGVLYHMTEPLQLLYDIARAAPQVVLWTHYYDAEVIAKRRSVEEHFGRSEKRELYGLCYEQVRYEYAKSLAWAGFCGGTAPFSYWLPRETILTALKHFGFGHVKIEFEMPEHPNGPSFAIVAWK